MRLFVYIVNSSSTWELGKARYRPRSTGELDNCWEWAWASLNMNAVSCKHGTPRQGMGLEINRTVLIEMGDCMGCVLGREFRVDDQYFSTLI